MPTIEMIKKAVGETAAMYPIRRIELFGSYANGTADDDSDVDLLVEFSEQPISLIKLCGFREKVAEQLHSDVDIVKLPLSSDSGLLIERTVKLYGA